MSGFGFMSPKKEDPQDEAKPVETGGERVASSFSFFGKKTSPTSAPSPPPVPAAQIVLDNGDQKSPQGDGNGDGSGSGAIKLEKAASSSKIVKKKKKVAGNRVGFDRGGAAGDLLPQHGRARAALHGRPVHRRPGPDGRPP